MSDLLNILSLEIAAAIEELLSHKHLYQSVEVKFSAVEESGRSTKKRIEQEFSAAGVVRSVLEKNPCTRVDEELAALRSIPWATDSGNLRMVTGYDNRGKPVAVGFELPRINTYCDFCEARPPFKPKHDETCHVNIDDLHDAFYLSYQCQQCGNSLVRFMVSRDEMKLKLTGRDPIESVPAPQYIPKQSAKYFSHASIAYNSGQTLAGIFLLRVLIEQFWRSIANSAKAEIDNSNIEQLSAVYQTTLPESFSQQFPSLIDLYGQLSQAIHCANSDPAIFEAIRGKIDLHFKAKQIFELAKK